MKILMINGTMRKGSTYQVGKLAIEEIMQEGDQLTELFLPKDMPEFCRGCAACIRESETRCLDYLMYMKRFTRMIDEADLLIFTSPVYVMHVSGAMKALLDHYGYRCMIHRPEASMFGKQAICIVTAAGGGIRSALKDIKDSLLYWGVARIYTLGVKVGTSGFEHMEQAAKDQVTENIRKLALKIHREPAAVKPGLKTKILFYIMRKVVRVGNNPADQKYWEEKGWLAKERPWKNKTGQQVEE